MSERRCDKCDFGIAEDTVGNREVGECRRCPPRVITSAIIGVATRWPVVHGDNWCGEFTPNLSAIERGNLSDADRVSIKVLGLSTRVMNCLASEGVKTVGDLARCSRDKLEYIRNFGDTSMLEVVMRLAGRGLTLAGENPG